MSYQWILIYFNNYYCYKIYLLFTISLKKSRDRIKKCIRFVSFVLFENVKVYSELIDNFVVWNFYECPFLEKSYDKTHTHN